MINSRFYSVDSFSRSTIFSVELSLNSFILCRHSNGSGSGNGHDHENGEDQPDDSGSLSRSASEGSVVKTQNGLNSNPTDNVNSSTTTDEKEQVNGYMFVSHC